MGNASIIVTRGTTTNAMGDKVPANTIVYTGPASISETSNRYYDQATQTPRTIRGLEMLVRSDVDVQTGDYVQDATRGARYVVQDVSRTYGLLFTPDKVCGLKRVN